MTIIDVTIDSLSNKKLVVDYIKNKFYRMTYKSAFTLVDLLLKNVTNITADVLTDKPKTLIRNNLGSFSEDKIKSEIVTSLRQELIDYICKYGRDLNFFYDIEEEKKLNKKEMILEVDDTTNYDDVYNKIFEEMGDINFKYKFDNNKVTKTIPNNTKMLQRCDIQILNPGIKMNFPIQYSYVCTECTDKIHKLANEVASTNNKVKCENFVQGSGDKLKRCNTVLSPVESFTVNKTIYVYDISYCEGSTHHNASAHSFLNIKPGNYEVVLFNVGGDKKEEFFIVDVKSFKTTKIIFPKKIDGINYLYTLQKTFDEYIKQQTGFEIWGLYPIKIALIIQALISKLEFSLNANIQIIGDSSTGKTTVLKYYGYLLNNQLNLSTNGNSISIPALRGTVDKILFMGKEVKILNPGYLGKYATIHVDEAGQNKELVDDLKTFLLDPNYGYNKAGGNDVIHKRTAQMNLSENINNTHLAMFRAGIKKIYKDTDVVIEGVDKEQWQEDWDLHQPLHSYTNPYLYRAIKNKREEFEQKQMFWIDGYELAVHQRFPFYFYLVKEKENSLLSEVAKNNLNKDIIVDNLQLIKVLNNEDINTWMEQLKQYKYNDNDVEAFNKVDEILNSYNINADIRTKIFYYTLLKISRIANMRMIVNEEDYDLVKLFIETTNCKLDVVDTNNYNLKGGINVIKIKEQEKEIEEKTKVSNVFGLPEGEFNA